MPQTKQPLRNFTLLQKIIKDGITKSDIDFLEKGDGFLRHFKLVENGYVLVFDVDEKFIETIDKI